MTKIESLMIKDDACMVSVGEVREALKDNKGEWERFHGDSIYIGLKPLFWCCDKCGYVDNNTPNFCPHCGADMRGSRNK